MDDKIIAAAREAGITASIGQTINGKYKPNVNALGRSVPVEWLSRFYALAYRQGLEDAAKVCDEEHKRARYNMDVDLSGNQPFWNGAAIFADQLGEAIRALKEQDTAIAAGKGESNGEN